MRLQGNECVSVKTFVRRFERQKVTRQCGNIFGTLTQWRHAQLELAETVEEIFAETAFFHRQLKILIGRGNHADIDGDLYDCPPKR